MHYKFECYNNIMLYNIKASTYYIFFITNIKTKLLITLFLLKFIRDIFKIVVIMFKHTLY